MAATVTLTRTAGSLNAESAAPLASIVGSVGSAAKQIIDNDTRVGMVVIDQKDGEVHFVNPADLANSGAITTMLADGVTKRATYVQRANATFESGINFNRQSGVVPGEPQSAPLSSLDQGSLASCVNKLFDTCTARSLIVLDQRDGKMYLLDADAAALITAVAALTKLATWQEAVREHFE